MLYECCTRTEHKTTAPGLWTKELLGGIKCAEVAIKEVVMNMASTCHILPEPCCCFLANFKVYTKGTIFRSNFGSNNGTTGGECMGLHNAQQCGAYIGSFWWNHLCCCSAPATFTVFQTLGLLHGKVRPCQWTSEAVFFSTAAQWTQAQSQTQTVNPTVSSEEKKNHTSMMLLFCILIFYCGIPSTSMTTRYPSSTSKQLWALRKTKQW